MSSQFASFDYANLQCLSQIWSLAAQQFGESIALYDPHSKPETKITFKQLNDEIIWFATALQVLGVKPQEKVALIADNSPRWFIADQGIMMAGAANAVRSSQAEKQELLYIYSHSDSTSLVVQDLKTLKKLKPELDDLSVAFVILLSDEEVKEQEGFKVLTFSEAISLGKKNTLTPIAQNRETLATLIYTSGTTGKPKGVMLTHGNFIHQITAAEKVLKNQIGDQALSILPSWHSYERSVEYYLISHGCTNVYTNIRFFKEDLKRFKPHFMVGVPRLWESIYEGVQKLFREQPASKQRLINFFFGLSEKYIVAKRIADNLSLEHPQPSGFDRLLNRLQATLLLPFHLLGDKIVYQKVREATGGKVKCFVSGGGSLARHLDLFYEVVNIPLIVGYGLTETSPITNVRRLDFNLRGASGPPLLHTEIRIVEPSTRQTLSPRQQGLVLIRGPQVMQGYYKNPEATAKAIDPQGWFDSGDLGMLTHNNNLVLTGRAKDTIVLSNGENIEPQPIEDACIRSPYIDQVMLVGQDKKALGALVVPNLEALQKWVKEENLNLSLPEVGENERKDIDNPALLELLKKELTRQIKDRSGYRRDDQITVFRVILEPFSIENGMMTQTLKIRRPVVREKYKELIAQMFQKN